MQWRAKLRSLDLESPVPQLLRTVRLIALFAFLSFATEALAQDAGTLTGTVSNINGAAQPGAIVRLAATRFFAVVDSSGRYQIARIPAGTYVTRITKLGFAPDTATIEKILARNAADIYGF